MPEPLPQGLWLGSVEFRIKAGQVGVAMMGEVKVAKPLERQEQDQATGAADPIVQGGIGKGRPVGRLVFEREEKDQKDALHRQGEGPERGEQDQGRGHSQRRKMPGQMPQTRRSRRLGEMLTQVRRQGGDQATFENH